MEKVHLVPEVTKNGLDDIIIANPDVQNMYEHLSLMILFISLHLLNLVHCNL